MESSTETKPFLVKDCALIPLATGVRTQTLMDFQEEMRSISEASLYYHFWGARLSSPYETLSYHNDFAGWAHDALHDSILAEQFEMLNPLEFNNYEELKEEMLSIIDERLDDLDTIPMTKRDQQFYFMSSKIVIFKTQGMIHNPEEMIESIKQMSTSSIFFHMIDALRRPPEKNNDFSFWLSMQGSDYVEISEKIKIIDPYFLTLEELKERILSELEPLS